MRIKKKNIREAIDGETSKDIDTLTTKTKETIEKVASDLESSGIEEPENVSIASSVVSTVMKDATVDEGVNNNNKPELLSNTIRPSMTKRELVESVIKINEASVKPSRRVIKTVKIKDLRNE